MAEQAIVYGSETDDGVGALGPDVPWEVTPAVSKKLSVVEQCLFPLAVVAADPLVLMRVKGPKGEGRPADREDTWC